MKKKDEKPFDSQFLSRIFHSDTSLRGREEESGGGRRVCVGGGASDVISQTPSSMWADQSVFVEA